MTTTPTSISATLEAACGHLPHDTRVAVRTTVADYLLRGDARGLRKRLSRAVAPSVAESERDSLAENLASTLQYKTSAKRVWKAVWETLHSTTTEEAAALYEVAAEDIDLVLTYAPEPTVEFLLAVPREEVRSNVEAEEVKKITRELNDHVRRVGNRLRFISMYDPAIDKEDINQDLILKALKTVYNYENMVPWDGTSYHTALLNKARSAANSGALDVIRYCSDPVRARVVGTYVCDACACTSDIGVKACEWCGASLEMVERATRYTTYWLDTGRLRERVAGGLSGEAEDVPMQDVQDQYVSLADDLVQHMDERTREYLCCLLRESRGFDKWLEEVHADTSDELTDVGIRKLAATYVGQPRKRLDKKLKQAARRARIR